jgi:beta-galactosidase
MSVAHTLLRRLLGSLLLAACTLAQAQRSSSLLDGAWQFQRADVPEAVSPTFNDAAWQHVTLPHTWNAPDGEVGGAYYRGPAWYRRVIERPATGDSGRRQFLEFDGATLAAEVWVNGQLAGRHEGGYARFRFDITALLHPGRNLLAVRVDNSALPQVAPLGGDFTIFGGLIRPVRLLDADTAHIDLLDHGGPGVQVDIEALTPTEVGLKLRVQLRNDAATAVERVLRVTLRDAEGRIVAERSQPVRLAASEASITSLSLLVPKPHLWQGVQDPYLYRLSAELLVDAAVTDAVELPLGLRQFKVDPERGFLLNGQPYPLHGVNYFHAGRPATAWRWAMPRSTKTCAS